MLFRKAILLIHGFAGGVWDYEPLSNELQLSLDFDVYSLTLPGHEKSRMINIKKEQWEEAVEQHIEMLIKRKYKKIYVIGHSMGGVLACHLAKKYPQV
ncbi:MAG: alpha/beta fold hydrolase, partial [bacterium]|nr:alpha/beta fold hydrolase [bacterium]